MEKKNNSGLIGCLIVIIIILIVAVILLATGTVSLNNNKTNTENASNNTAKVTDDSINNGNKNEDEKTLNDNNSTENNVNDFTDNVDETVLNELLPMIGVDNSDYNCFLPMFYVWNNVTFISGMEKSDIARMLIYYALYNKQSKGADATKCLGDNYIVAPGGSCSSYSKDYLNSILSKFNTNYSLKEIFDSRADIKEDNDNYYLYYDWAGFCSDITITHNISSKYSKQYLGENKWDDLVVIRDHISLDYDNGDKSNRVIYYEFVKDNNGKYKLTLVRIK